MTPSSKPLPLSCAAVREVDRRAIHELGIPGIVLMENAARGAAEAARDLLGSARGTVWIFCGPGNNGGDGYAMARWFTIFGMQVELISCVPPEASRGDAAVMRKIAAALHITDHVAREAADYDRLAQRLSEAALIVDALLGTGSSGAVRSPLDQAIRVINAARATQGPRVLAVDLPSGLDADTGAAAATTVRADVTTTFVAPKPGFDVPGARDYTGSVEVIGIGVPPALVEAVRNASS